MCFLYPSYSGVINQKVCEKFVLFIKFINCWACNNLKSGGAFNPSLSRGGALPFEPFALIAAPVQSPTSDKFENKLERPGRGKRCLHAGAVERGRVIIYRWDGRNIGILCMRSPQSLNLGPCSSSINMKFRVRSWREKSKDGWRKNKFRCHWQTMRSN